MGEPKAAAPTSAIDIVKRALATIAGLLAKQPVLLYVEWIPHAGFVPGQPPQGVGEMVRTNASVLLARTDIVRLCLPVPDSSKAHWHCAVRVVAPDDACFVVEGNRTSREYRERDVEVAGVVVAVRRGDFGWLPVPQEVKPNA